jgi:hypothetical protein
VSKKFTKGFSDLRTLLKKTETEAEAKAALKSEQFSTRKLPTRPAPVTRPPRQMSANDKFIVDTLEIKLEALPLDQLYDARLTLIDALEVVSNSKISIQSQIDSKDDHLDESGHSWKERAKAALRFKGQEEQLLKNRVVLADELIARKKPAPPLKLVTPAPVSNPPPNVVTPYEIRTNIPRPSVRLSANNWDRYPFDKLETVNHSFCFGPEIDAGEARGLITAAQRGLGRFFSYRTMPDGIIAVWRTDGPSNRRRKPK